MESIKKHPPPPRVHVHFTFSDGSVLQKMRARDLVKLPIWQGNRLLDEEHKQTILRGLKGNLKALDAKPFHLVTYTIQDESGQQEVRTCIVDGQHRVSILKEGFQNNPACEDFDILVVEKRCESETDVIRYFRILNTVKAIPWREDPNLSANRFIKALEAQFNTKKQLLIRPGGTRKPYLSVEKLREELVKRRLGQQESDPSPDQFAERVHQWNQKWLVDCQLNLDPQLEKYKKLAFGLAYDDRLKWIDVCLTLHRNPENHGQ